MTLASNEWGRSRLSSAKVVDLTFLPIGSSLAGPFLRQEPSFKKLVALPVVNAVRGVLADRATLFLDCEMEEEIYTGSTGSGGEPEYRLYCLNEEGKIARADWIDAQDDDEAIAIARSMEKSVECEIWKGDRLVARIPAVQFSE
jgi:hypothetical protein